MTVAAGRRWYRLPSGILHGEKPRWQCDMCGRTFFEYERAAYIDHCVKGHSHEEVRAKSPRVQAPGLFDPDAGDAEWAKWVRDHQASDPHGWKRWLRTDDGKHSSGLGDGA